MTGVRPARTPLIIASVVGIVAALATFVVIITVHYRGGLEQRLRTDLASGATAIRLAGTDAARSSVVNSSPRRASRSTSS